MYVVHVNRNMHTRSNETVCCREKCRKRIIEKCVVVVSAYRGVAEERWIPVFI